MWKKYEDEKDKKEKEEKKKTPEELIASYSKEKLLKKYRNPYNLSREERAKLAYIRKRTEEKKKQKQAKEKEKKVQKWYETLEKSYQKNKLRITRQKRKKQTKKKKNIFQKFDDWVESKARKRIEEIENSKDYNILAKMPKLQFWYGFTGQKSIPNGAFQSHSSEGQRGAVLRGTLNFLEGTLEGITTLDNPVEFFQQLIDTPKAFGQMKELVESGNMNAVTIATTELSWGFGTATIIGAKGASGKVGVPDVTDQSNTLAKKVEKLESKMTDLADELNKCDFDNFCFVAGTLIKTETGKKAIEKISLGEEVWCEDVTTGEQYLKKVVKCIENVSDILYHIYIEGKEIQITEEHPVWVEGSGWKKAKELHVNDEVRLYSGENRQIENIWIEKLAGGVKVYNLTVEDYHNYYVSDAGVLMHNAGCPGKNKVNFESGKKGSGLPAWLKKHFDEGNDFNRQNRPRYPYNEVEVYGDNKKYVVDSYIPNKEIVSRKYTQFSEILEKTGIGYLNELAYKYPSGAIITDSPFNPKVLRGQELKGDLILEIPVQKKPIPQSILDVANKKKITIRDVTGKEYN